jgi:hypothetical protein
MTAFFACASLTGFTLVYLWRRRRAAVATERAL